MVFSSVPLYLDPPNWQHQHPNQQLQGNGTANHEINQHHLNNIPPPPLPQPPPHHQVVGLGGGGGGGGGGTPPIRPNSMAERARMAKIPPPEAPLKCPRCDSTNTKFCYFNNYSLAQPRHFCKTCRRYWTRGGALRNVPVGGGCRRNKRSSGSKSASSTTSSASASTTTSSKSLSSSLSAMDPTIPSGGFMASLHNIAQLGMGNLGLSFGGSTTGLHNSNPVLDQLDHYGSTTNSNNLNALLNHHHHHNQVANFPNFLGGFEIPGSSTTSFQNVVVGGGDDDQVVGKGMTTSISNLSSMMGVKMEDSALNIEKGLLMGISTSEMNNATSTPANNSQFWGGGNANNMWSSTITHLPGLNSSSTAMTNNLI